MGFGEGETALEGGRAGDGDGEGKADPALHHPGA